MTYIGTAGWALPAPHNHHFPEPGTHLQRYAARFSCVEINSSFYGPHRRSTYERWADSVPRDFRFSVKVPRIILREILSGGYGEPLKQFLDETSGLGDRLGVLLIQLPPSLHYDATAAQHLFRQLSGAGAALACEPRHTSWFTPQAANVLKGLRVARVAADPPRAPGDGVPGGDTRFGYFRLHGSPKIYYSDYSIETLGRLAFRLRRNDWCIFDNTGGSHAVGNALTLQSLFA